MGVIETRIESGYRWHVRCALWLLICVLGGCASARTSARPIEAPSEEARHRAALATVIISNATGEALTIVFESATPPLQTVRIGQVTAAATARMAPVPAGEPIVLIARRVDGNELRLGAHSFAPDTEWTWEIPQNATFVKPDRVN